MSEPYRLHVPLQYRVCDPSLRVHLACQGTDHLREDGRSLGEQRGPHLELGALGVCLELLRATGGIGRIAELLNDDGEVAILAEALGTKGGEGGGRGLGFRV